MGLIEFLNAFLLFLNRIVVPLLFAIAFFVFVINTIRFFILESAEEEGRKKAKDLAIYGISAFVIIVSLWGIVNLFVKDLFPGDNRPVLPDYFGK